MRPETLRHERQKPALVLDPVERVSEIVFGILMAVTCTGSLSVAGHGDHTATMLAAALGCNLAWGFTDAVMYLVGVATERHRRVALLRRLQATRDKAEAHRLIAGEFPDYLAPDGKTVEALHERLLAAPVPVAGLGIRDYLGALSVFGLIVLATFQVVIPFLVFKDAVLSLRVSYGLALATLFAGGFFLGRYAGGSPWRAGLAMTALGAALVGIILALGG